MSSELITVQLKDIADLKGGYAFKSKEYTDDGMFVLRTVNINDDGNISRSGATFVSLDAAVQYERFRLREWDTLFVMVGATLGKTGLVKSDDLPALLNQNMWVIRATSDIVNPRYLHYIFRHNSKELLRFASGAARDFLRRDDFRNMELSLPPRKAQDNITNLVGSIDDKIQLNHQINQTLEQMAQAIFKSWFVDFEPVKAKIAALEAGGTEADTLLAAMQVISGKDADQLAQMQAEQPEQYAELRATAELFPSAMQDSELGEIPEGWEAKPLSSVIDLIGGGTPKKSEPSYWGGDICWFSVKDAPNEGNVFVIDTEDKITEAGLNGSSTKLLPLGTTIITARGTVGKLALTGVITAMNQSCYGVVGSDGTGPYLNYLRLHRAVDTLKRNTHGAVFDTITRTTFETVIQPQASLELRQRFDEVVGAAFETIKCNLQQAEKLSELRDTLLPKLLSGELTLPDIEVAQAELQDVANAAV